MVLEQATMQLSRMGEVTKIIPQRVPKLVLLWKKIGLAIHRSSYIGDMGSWTISHYNSGRSVVKYIRTKEQAVECLQKLYDILEDWTFTEEEWNAQENQTKQDIKMCIDELQQKVLEGRV